MPEPLYASFADPSLAERAVGALLDAGARSEDVSFLAHEAYGQGRTTNTAPAAVTPPSASAPNWSGTAPAASSSVAPPTDYAGTTAAAGTVTGSGAGTTAAPSTVSPTGGGATITNAGPAYPT